MLVFFGQIIALPNLNKGSDKMNLFAMKATYPLDEQTIAELESLLQKSQQEDKVAYEKNMQKDRWSDAKVRAFMVLAYDDEEDQLIAVLNAYDTLGLNAFEWTLLVDPDYRNIGIEEVLIEGLKHGLDERQASGEMAAVFKQQKLETILLANGYQYSAAKIVMQAIPEVASAQTIQVSRYENTDLAMFQQLMADGFHDLPEETAEFVEMMADENTSDIWVVRKNEEIVATMTTAIVENDIWITAFTTAASHRNQGIALSLLKWVKNYAQENNLTQILLEVESENPQALALYEKADFVNIEQLDYYVVQ